ncbi:MAG: carbohydrate kinase, YjeF related protein [Hyphomicrobiales bacterium]|nr:carbohydrate kinase, YjeF related protein [Hyphomicrobiales bacterium]
MTSWRAFTQLLDPHEMARADALAIAAGHPGMELMERAGAAVAAEAARLTLPDSRATPRVTVLCGPGNNGGDGFVAARLLKARGFVVRLYLLGAVADLRGDAKTAALQWTGLTDPLAEYVPGEDDLVIDALFGAGLARDLDGEARKAVERTNQWRRETGHRVLAVDVPSGVDGATGGVRGVAIEADASVTFFRLKPGHILLPGRLLCGALRLVDIGIPSDVLTEIAPRTALNGPALWAAQLPMPATEGHKYMRGHALVVSGPAWKTGAARLSARGALRIGAGLVTVAAPFAALPEHAAHLTSIMLSRCDGASDLVRLLDDVRKNAVVLGPGLGTGEDSRELVHAALAPSRRRGLVLDADAITLFTGAAEDLGARIEAHGGEVVLTPHGGEFSRLSRGLRRSLQLNYQALEAGPETFESKLEAARALAGITGAVLVLKGADTVIASPDGRAAIAADLPADLATAGSGDVLAGMIGGLLAQGMPAYEAACAAVWLHGAAGRSVGRGLIAEDLPDALPAAFGMMHQR